MRAELQAETEAERLERIGRMEINKGHKLTAAGYLFRAAHYYQVGERFMQPKTDASNAAYQRAVAAFRTAPVVWISMTLAAARVWINAVVSVARLMGPSLDVDIVLLPLVAVT